MASLDVLAGTVLAEKAVLIGRKDGPDGPGRCQSWLLRPVTGGGTVGSG